MASWKSWLTQPHQCIERVTVFPQSMRKESIVKRVLGGREQSSVKPNGTSFMIHFVFIARPLRDLHNHFNFHGPLSPESQQ